MWHALSRLGMVDNSNGEIEWETLLPPSFTYQDEARERLQLLFPLAVEKELKPTTKFPLGPDLIKYYQLRDKTANTTSTSVTVKSTKGEDLIHHNRKVCIPPALRKRVLDWYYTMLVHPGEARTKTRIRSVYTRKRMRRDVQLY